jgi:NADPH-ferrihemoprotein reductase
MIGPGTGVAPFRAFVQERAHESAQGKQVGKTMLFYGCRNPDEDFLYREEWKVSLIG